MILEVLVSLVPWVASPAAEIVTISCGKAARGRDGGKAVDRGPDKGRLVCCTKEKGKGERL